MDNTNQQPNKSFSGKLFNFTSYKKFQNVQRLASLVDQIHNKQQNLQNNHKTQVSQKVLTLIKNRIKNKYDTLYEKYDNNKQQIYKQIHQVQRNDDTQSVMSKRVSQIIREKNQYDKLKLQIQKKQKQLQKLYDLKYKIELANGQNKQLVNTVKYKYNQLKILQDFQVTLDYQNAIFENMKKDRKQLKIHLKQKYQTMLKENNNKDQRIKKLQDGNHIKRLLLKRIQEQLKKYYSFQIPLPLAEQLQKKLGQFQGKHNYANLVEHQMHLQKIREQQQIKNIQKQKNQIRKLKLKKQLQQKREYQIIQQHFQIKKGQQQRIKKLCNIKDLKQISQDPLKYDFQNLQIIKKQTQKQINNLRKQKENLQYQIQIYLTIQKQNNILQRNTNLQSKQNLLSIQEQLQNQQTQLRRLSIHYDKKKQSLQKWISVSQFIIGNNASGYDIIDSLYDIIPRLQKLVIKEKVAEKKSSFKYIYENKNNQNQKEKEKQEDIKKFKAETKHRYITESQFNDDEIN